MKLLFIALTFILSTTHISASDSLVLNHLNSGQQENILAIDFDKLIGPYPKLGTPESDKDFNELFYWQQTRTEAQCAQAKIEEKVSLNTFFGGKTGPLTQKEVKRLKFFFYEYMLRGGAPSTIAKFKYKRPRPYDTDTDLKPCIKLSNSYAYPSGHTTVSRVVAHMLAVKFPQRRDAFMQRADEIAQNRVIGGVHHPSDIVAGKILADELAKDLVNSPSIIDILKSL